MDLRLKKWFFLSINIIASILVFLLFAPSYSFVHYINAVFYVGFPYLMVAMLLYTIRGRFFDGIVFGFRRFKRNNKRTIEEIEDKPLPSKQISRRLLHTFLFQGGVLTAVMLVLLLFYYL